MRISAILVAFGLIASVACSNGAAHDDAAPTRPAPDAGTQTATGSPATGQPPGPAASATATSQPDRGGDAGTSIVVECRDGDMRGHGSVTLSPSGLSGAFDGVVTLDWTNALIWSATEEAGVLTALVAASLSPTMPEGFKLALSPEGWLKIDALQFRSCDVTAMRELIDAIRSTAPLIDPANPCTDKPMNADCMACCRRPWPNVRLRGDRTAACECANGCGGVCDATACSGGNVGAVSCGDCLFAKPEPFGTCWTQAGQECAADPACAAAEQCIKTANCMGKP